MRSRSIIGEIIGYIGIAAIFFCLFTFVFEVAHVSGNSMNDTYQDGDTLFCLRIGTALEKGDVVICNTDEEKTLIKRIIGTEGDIIDIDFEKGTVSVNGEVLSESYIKEPTYLDEGGFDYPITVPEGCYFVMGDNRNHSTDSRDASVGYIDGDQIQSKVIFEIPFA